MIRATIALILVILASSMDYTDTVASESDYTTMVCSGHWPDYQQLEPACHDY